MSIRRILSLILSLAMLFALALNFAACDYVEEEDGTNAPTDATEAPTSAPTEKATKKPSSNKKPNYNKNGDSDLTGYDLKKYLSPVWSGSISYAESAFVKENENGEIDPIQLLYPIDEIISVRSADLKTLYKNGEDYYIEDGKIVILVGGKIPVLAYEDYIFDDDGRTTSAAGGKPITAYGQPGKKFVYGEISTQNGGMSQWVIAVTYKHSADNILTVPEDKSDRFANFTNKLEAGEDVTIVSIGDSITEGWSSSLVKGNRAPYCPPYNDMVAQYVQSTYKDTKVTFKNLGKSGTTANGGNISSGSPNGNNPDLLNEVCAANPDLVMVAYGMNDGCGSTPDTYANNISSIVKYIQEKCPESCIVIVGTSLPNPDFAWDGGGRCLVYHDQYPEALAAKEKTWVDEDYNVAVADVTTMNIEMYQRKIYQDLTGSNSNHPNDFMHRIYAQVIIQTIFGDYETISQ